MSFKSGFVSIIGRPNVGKSTLLNALMGEKISIITPKAQTTRHRIKGILNLPGMQIVFSDTPGIIEPRYTMQGQMMKFVNESLSDSDLILFVADFGALDEDEQHLEKLKEVRIPMICLLNKIDEHKQEEVQQRLEYWTAKEMFREVIPVSALNKFNIDILPSHLASYLPEGAAFYDEDQITDKSEKFIASEIIREKIMMRYKEEIPYSVQVEIESFKEEEQIIRISAIIYVMRETQRKILIGKGGIAIKQTGIAARRDLEQFFNKKIFLETYVKVKENWRDNEKLLKDWGYES